MALNPLWLFVFVIVCPAESAETGKRHFCGSRFGDDGDGRFDGSGDDSHDDDDDDDADDAGGDGGGDHDDDGDGTVQTNGNMCAYI